MSPPPRVRPEPCDSCPYRVDTPSGVWAAEEYQKLPAYDAPTPEQPVMPFHCHQTPSLFCCGWAVVGMNRGHAYQLLALRLAGAECEIPQPSTPLYASGAEAAEHGLLDIQRPGRAARAVMAKLYVRSRRLREANPRPARRRRQKDPPA